ncbi:NTPase [candidate division KSB1 bacterium]|nr:NTPase [candidate division KSB1 bacterium]
MKNLLLTGRPGTGKTTLIKKALESCSLQAGGFYTQELREHGHRTGFEIISLAGQKAVMAHINMKSRYKVGKYGVDKSEIERIAIKSIFDALDDDDIIIIDEIGKMELLSDRFKQAVLTALDSPKHVLGTIMLSQSAFTQTIKKSPHIELLIVTESNREQIFQQALSIVQQWEPQKPIAPA